MVKEKPMEAMAAAMAMATEVEAEVGPSRMPARSSGSRRASREAGRSCTPGCLCRSQVGSMRHLRRRSLGTRHHAGRMTTSSHGLRSRQLAAVEEAATAMAMATELGKEATGGVAATAIATATVTATAMAVAAVATAMAMARAVATPRQPCSSGSCHSPRSPPHHRFRMLPRRRREAEPRSGSTRPLFRTTRMRRAWRRKRSSSCRQCSPLRVMREAAATAMTVTASTAMAMAVRVASLRVEAASRATLEAVRGHS